MARQSTKVYRTRRPAPAGGSALETLAIVVVVAAVLYLGRAIAIPIAIAILISFSLGPPVSWLTRRHIGRIPAIFLVVAPAMLAVGAFAYVVTIEVGRLAGNIPAYSTNIESKVDGIADLLPSRAMLDRGTAFLRDLGKGARPGSSAASHMQQQHGHQPLSNADGKPVTVEIQTPDPSPVDIVRAIVGPLVEPVSDAALVLLFVVFFLAEKDTLRDRLIRLAGVRDLRRTTMAMDEAGTRVSRYLLMQTLVNAAFGTVLTAALFLLGLPNAALWGGLAAMLRFIPYMGVATASVLPIALAFAVDPGWTMLVWTAGVFLVLELLTGNVLEPWLYGSSTGLSAVALVLSAIFWTWLWGAIGLLLATPLTVCIAVLGRYVPQLAFLDVLLGNQAPLKPEEAFYQRLLAGHPDEAAKQATAFVAEHSPQAFFAEVALPALMLAERDRLRGELEGEHLVQVADGVKTLVNQLVDADDAIPNGSPGDSATVVLVAAGRSELDEAAGALLAAMLRAGGHAVLTLPYSSALHVALPDIDPARIGTVCLSYLDPEAVPHARYLARRFRRRVGPHVCLIACFWKLPDDFAQIENARTETRADHVALTLEGAVEAVGRGRPQAGDVTELEGAELADLAKRVSEAVGELSRVDIGDGLARR